MLEKEIVISKGNILKQYTNSTFAHKTELFFSVNS